MWRSRPSDRRIVALVLALAVAAAAATAASVRVAMAAGSPSIAQATGGGEVVAVQMIGEGSLQHDGIEIGPNTHWTAIPGAYGEGTVLRVKLTIPAGHTAVFRATLSGDAFCSSPGEGQCAVRVVANGAPFVPQSSDFGQAATNPGNPFAATSTQFYTPHPYGPGTYTIVAQAEFPFGAYMGFLSNLLTVDEIQTS